MKTQKTRFFAQQEKKLKKNQKLALDKAVQDIEKNPAIGQEKKGDLRNIRVHKFKMVGQLTLIAYDYDGETVTLTLLMFGSHENFYRDLKR